MRARVSQHVLCSILASAFGDVLRENRNHIFICKIPIQLLPSLLTISEKQDLVLKGPAPTMFPLLHSV